MREILFKAKTINGDWVEGVPLSYGDGVFVFTDGMSRKDSEKIFAKNHEVIPQTVCQFTGLLDKNGKKIFEGDIVIHGKGKFIIKYFKEFGMFCIAKSLQDEKPCGHRGSSTNYSPYILSNHYQKRMEVIGNIHDKE